MLRDATADCTPQELRILRLIGEGLSHREIADRLGIAEKTVKNYITGLFAKLGVSRRTHAAAVAWRLPGAPAATRRSARAGPRSTSQSPTAAVAQRLSL